MALRLHQPEVLLINVCGDGGAVVSGLLNIRGVDCHPRTIHGGRAFHREAWCGEEYPDGSVDDPDFDWLAGTIGEFTLDDRTIVPDLENYYVPIRWLQEPVVYQEPTDWGSIATVYLEGYAFLITPLPVGVHTFTSTVWLLWLSEDPIFDFSFTITVAP